MIKKIVFSLCILLIGFIGGFVLCDTNDSTDKEVKNIVSVKASDSKNGRLFEKKIMTKLNVRQDSHKNKSFSIQDLKALIKRLAKNPDSKQLRDELNFILQYPYKQGDKSLELAMYHLFSYWGKIAPRDAMEAVQGLSGTWLLIKTNLFQSALAWDIEHNPKEVADWFIDSSTGLFLHKDILPALSSSLTKQSPEEAWKWLCSLRYEEQNRAIINFFQEVALTYPEKMKGYIEQLESPENWGTSISRDWREALKIPVITRLYAQCDYVAAEAWVETFPESWQSYAIESLAGVRAENDIVGATEMLKTHPNVLSEIANTVLNSNDNEKIGAWLKMLAEISPKVTPANYLFISKINANDALPMIKNLPAGKVKDSLGYCYITSNINLDINVLEDLLYGIQDQELNKRASEEIEHKRKNNKY